MDPRHHGRFTAQAGAAARKAEYRVWYRQEMQLPASRPFSSAFGEQGCGRRPTNAPPFHRRAGARAW